MSTHELKTWPRYFEAVRAEVKTFEVRRDDRDFQVGDLLHLKEWDPLIGEYTGGHLQRRVIYALRDAEGIQPGFVVLGLVTVFK